MIVLKVTVYRQSCQWNSKTNGTYSVFTFNVWKDFSLQKNQTLWIKVTADHDVTVHLFKIHIGGETAIPHMLIPSVWVLTCLLIAVQKSEINVFSFPFKKTFYWTMVGLQCRVSFRSVSYQSVIHTHASALFYILFPHGSLQSTEQGPPCSTADPH